MEHYKERSDSLSSGRIESLTRWFGMAKSALAAFQQLNAAQQRTAAPHFNLFRVLGLARREVRTHSAFLAELLNPKGSHGQGGLFLRTFLEHLDLPGALADEDDWDVRTEVAEAWLVGRLDIMLRSAKAKAVVAIENKIDAMDQEEQLPRYWYWLQKSHRHDSYPPERKVLVYLTINGNEPPVGNHVARKMSYKIGVLAWLNETGTRVGAPRMADMLQQYIDIIKGL